jgi:hypothetical protein
MKKLELPAQTIDMGHIKPAINPKGYSTSLKEYDEATVIEEIAANSYDAYASTALFLLDEMNSKLYVFDDGKGFNNDAMTEMLTLGGGKKEELFAHAGTRVYLGSYGFGFKAVVNIAKEISIVTCSEEDNKRFSAFIDLAKFDAMMEKGVEGYPFDESLKPQAKSKGTIITLKLKKLTTKKELDEFIKVLGNLPNDNGKFNCYCGFYSSASTAVAPFQETFEGLAEIAKKLQEDGKVQLVSNIFDSELDECEPIHVSDKENNASGIIYFAGIQSGRAKPLKESLRGVYVRIHGRLLKADFSTDRYTKNITKYIQFKSSMRTELSIDWLRTEITLSRTGIKFNNEQLESVFKKTLNRTIGQFCTQQYAKLETLKDKASDKRLIKRLELARKRVSKSADIVIKDIKAGFIFKPDSDAELAIILAQDYIMNRISPSYQLIDYNAHEPFDCILYDKSRDEFIHSELEPTLLNFLEHKHKSKIQLIICWSLGGWKLSSPRKKGKGGWFELTHPANSQKGHYKLLQFASDESSKLQKSFQVIIVGEILK